MQSAMPALRKNIPPDIVAEARRLYEKTLTPMDDIAAMMGVCRSTLENRVRQWKWKKRAASGTAVDIARAVRGTVAATMTKAPKLPMPDETRLALAERIVRVVEEQIDAVGRVVERLGPADDAEAERSARTLASLTRSMREIAALITPDTKQPDEADDDSVPLDLDELRNELARRLHALIDAREARENGDRERVAGADEGTGS